MIILGNFYWRIFKQENLFYHAHPQNLKIHVFFYERARNERMPQFRQSASFFADEPGACDEKPGETPGGVEKPGEKTR